MYKSSKPYLLKIFLSCYLLVIANNFFFEWINNYINCNLSNPLDKDPIYNQFIMSILIAPVMETLLFQYLPNHILSKIRLTNRYILLIIPGLIFGLAHIGYSWLYALAMFFAGLLINFFFLKAKSINKYSFWLTALLHGLYNLFCLVMILLLG